MTERLEYLETLFKPVYAQHPINNFFDFKNIRVLVVTLPKTGTSSLALSFQLAIDNTSDYKNVLHAHNQRCFEGWLPHLAGNNLDIKDFIDYYIYNEEKRETNAAFFAMDKESPILTSGDKLTKINKNVLWYILTENL
jgi:hypothetical protein